MTSAALAERRYLVEQLVRRWKQDPVDCVNRTFTADPYGNPLHVDPNQRRILEAVRDHDRVAVCSGRGVGKTATAAMLTYWWLTTREPALVVTSAGSWAHLSDKLWPEIHGWGKRWLFKEGFEFQSLGIYSNVDRETWRAVGRSSDKAVNVEGFHSPNFLLIIDEAKGMPDEIFAALVASLSGSAGPGTQKCVALSTPPTADVGWYAKACSSERWKLVRVSGLDSDRVSEEYIEDIKETFGENSPEFAAYVLGVIPEGITGQLIRKRWVEDCQNYEPEGDRRPPVIVCDVARGGSDLCIIGVIKERTFNLVKFEDRWGWFSESDLMDVVRRIAQAVKMHKAKAVCLDDTGLGGGVTDRLRELQAEGGFPRNCTIWPVNFGAQPRRMDRFKLRKHEMWWQLREYLRQGMIGLPTDEEIREWRVPKDTVFKDQLLAPIYQSDERERVWVYDKRVTGKEITKALPLKSPDLAHALLLGVDYYHKQEEAPEPLELPGTQEEALRQMMKKIINEYQAKAKRSAVKDPFRRKTR